MNRPVNDLVTHRLYSIIFRMDVPNKNNRIYPRDIVLKAIDDYKKKSSMIGCLLDGDTQLNPQIDIAKITHIITDIAVDEHDNTVWAEAQFLTTPYALNFADMLYKKQLSGLSCGHLVPTGYGVLDKDGRVESYEIRSIDVTLGESGV